MMTLRLSGGLSPMGMRSIFMAVYAPSISERINSPLSIAAVRNEKRSNRIWAAQSVRRNEKIGFTLSARSEEHTSELQSLMRISYAVFCLKKKQTIFSTLQQKTN